MLVKITKSPGDKKHGLLITRVQMSMSEAKKPPTHTKTAKPRWVISFMVYRLQRYKGTLSEHENVDAERC